MTALLQDLVAARVGQHPDAEAISTADGGMSYAELEYRSNQVARLLREHGCRRGDRICVLSPTSPNAIVAMLGILKADAIYVPLDPTGPATGLAAAVQLVGPACLLVAGSTSRVVDQIIRSGAISPATCLASLERGPIARQEFVTAFSMADLDRVSNRPLAARNRAANPAWVQFRRGSSAASPGVVATHSGLARSLVWVASHFGVRPGDRHAALSPLASDRSVYETLGTLAAGATVHPAPLDIAGHPRRLADFLRRMRLTFWLTSPEALTAFAHADVVAPADFPELRHVAWWGTAIPRSTLQHWITRVKHVDFTSLYGSPEATIASAYYTWPKHLMPRSDVAPVGTPCPGQEVLVLTDQLQVAAVGETGDIWIRGTGVSPGYWADQPETARVFKQGFTGGPGGDRMCRTGDRGHRDHLGEIYVVNSTGPDLHPETLSTNGRAVA